MIDLPHPQRTWGCLLLCEITFSTSEAAAWGNDNDKLILYVNCLVPPVQCGDSPVLVGSFIVRMEGVCSTVIGLFCFLNGITPYCPLSYHTATLAAAGYSWAQCTAALSVTEM